MDVFTVEPQEGERFESRFRELDNVVLTSHLAASTKEGQRKISIEIAQGVIEYLVGENVFVNAVNVGETVASEQRITYRLFITHRDVPGAFHQIDGVLAQHNINIRDNPSRQFGKDGSVITVYRVHQPIKLQVLADLRRLDIVYRATL